MSSDPGLTPAGNWLGTVHFAAPEQIRARPIDARADVYALGGVLFWALTGRVPYERGSDMAEMNAHLNDPPPVLASAAPDAPAELGAVVTRAMANDRAERYQSAGDVGRAARAAVEGRAPAAPERTLAAGAAAAGGPAGPDAPTRDGRPGRRDRAGHRGPR